MNFVLFFTVYIVYVQSAPLLSHEVPDPKHGLPWDFKTIRAARLAMKMDTNVLYFKRKLIEYGAYCNGKTDQDMNLGAVLVMTTAMKLTLMPAATFGTCSEDDHTVDQPTHCTQKAGKIYGSLKLAAMRGDGAEIERILQQNGGNTHGLSHNMLVKLWGMNEHKHLHATLCKRSPAPPLLDADKVFHAVHLTSLSDGITSNEYWGPRVPTTLGGYNNFGSWPERSWFESAKAYPALFPEAFN